MAVFLATAGILLLFCTPAPAVVAESDTTLFPLTLSRYWHAKVLRWEPMIIEAANARYLDPDFLASLVWMESRGDAYAVGPVGAVGLMQVMPKEAGFTWRPSHEALIDPGINLFWGTRTLATVIRQGNGDLFNALAAYNGGWDQITYRGPTIFATTILRDYAHAVASRQGIKGNWIAFFARKDIQIAGPIWVADSDRSDVYYYGNDNVVPEGMPLIPNVSPSSVVAYSYDEKSGRSFYVGIWLFDVDSDAWISTPISTDILSELAKKAVPTVAQPVITAPVPAKPEIASTVAATPEVTETPAPEIACPGGDFWIQAWPLESTVHLPSWSVRIYAEGHGGDCQYTYAWNEEDDVKGQVTGGPITFVIETPHRDGNIIGTVVVSSAGETRRVQIYVPSPKK